MNIPGFTAEASLYKTSGFYYGGNAFSNTAFATKLIPVTLDPGWGNVPNNTPFDRCSPGPWGIICSNCRDQRQLCFQHYQDCRLLMTTDGQIIERCWDCGMEAWWRPCNIIDTNIIDTTF